MADLDSIYDRDGNPIFRISEDAIIIDFGGEPRAWLKDEHIYGFDGSHIGFYQNGLIRDHNGNVVGFGENPSGLHPVLPVKKIKPVPAVLKLPPLKPLPELPPLKPIDSLNWSEYDLIEFL